MLQLVVFVIVHHIQWQQMVNAVQQLRQAAVTVIIQDACLVIQDIQKMGLLVLIVVV